MSSSEPSESVARNVASWLRANAEYTDPRALEARTKGGHHVGAFDVPLHASREAVTHEYHDFVSADWARRWPAEEIWQARKRA